MSHGMMILELDDTIKVSIQQFYGIEINDFAVKVAKTALWIAEAQMWNETKKIVSTISNINDFLPLESYNNIYEGNALRIDWNEVLPKTSCNYIMGNPPFVGARLMNNQQKQDISYIFRGLKGVGNIDYVGCWYKKTAQYILDTKIHAALVSTNSICQGEQVCLLWKDLIENGLKINFAHKTFIWDSEASIKARVHCVIVGFSYEEKNKKVLYDKERKHKVEYINAYLVDAPSVFVNSRTIPICNVPKMDFGSMPNDGGYLSNYSKEHKERICEKYPKATNLFRKILGAEEFINNKERYCLWLKDVSPKEYNYIPEIMEAIRNVKHLREQSSREATRKLALYPYLFGEIRQPDSKYLLVPSTSSERRRYIPIGFIQKDVIASNANLVIPAASLYNFGVLTSNVHMAWMRTVAGRLKSDYRYSAKIVYNNFPWPTPTDEKKKNIEKTAQMILDARNKYSNSSLADLYDELTMPPELRKAHQMNDIAVMDAYGFNWKKMTETDCVAKLMEMYKSIIDNKS